MLGHNYIKKCTPLHVKLQELYWVAVSLDVLGCLLNRMFTGTNKNMRIL